MRTKTIVVDAMAARQGGGQTYLHNLFKYVPDAGHSVRVIAVVPPVDVFRGGDRVEYITPSFSAGNLPARLLWTKTRLPALLRSVRAAVLFCPGGSVAAFGNGGWKTAVTFRNMLPFDINERRRFPYGYTRARLAGLRYIQARSFEKADLVIFLSEYARSVIDTVAGRRRGRSLVIPHGVVQGGKPPDRKDGVDLPAKYIAYVSVLDAYKAQLEVVEAWSLMRRARRCTEKLLLVGPSDTPYADKVRRRIAALGLQAEVVLTGNIAPLLLPTVYGRAIANVFASSCENCPNILLEAMAAGRPLLCSDYQPMPELAGAAPLYFDPYSPQTLAHQFCRVLDDDALRAQLARASRERAATFQWRETSQRTWQALCDLA